MAGFVHGPPRLRQMSSPGAAGSPRAFGGAGERGGPPSGRPLTRSVILAVSADMSSDVPGEVRPRGIPRGPRGPRRVPRRERCCHQSLGGLLASRSASLRTWSGFFSARSVSLMPARWASSHFEAFSASCS
ncbi:hypothetical protein QJS66_02420 [Kocuria rhizophila]|nr:hypothetical protein QJS66_02420 [Kocuria rhizophila]